MTLHLEKKENEELVATIFSETGDKRFDQSNDSVVMGSPVTGMQIAKFSL